MIKHVAGLLGIAMCFSLCTPVVADENTPMVDDVVITTEELERISTREDWLDLLESVGQEYRAPEDDSSTVVSFGVSYDDDRDVIVADTVYFTRGTASTTSGSASHEEYSTSGLLAYTVTVQGTFSRVSGSYCTCTSATGSFTHPALSLWRSTPSFGCGNVSSVKAYAKTYGTAKMPGSSINYALYLYCTSGGTLSSSYTES